tara:strand:- start:4582 stop:4683 length:102 start_codon:yes stop_codon:yes gene_type:complete
MDEEAIQLEIEYEDEEDLEYFDIYEIEDDDETD